MAGLRSPVHRNQAEMSASSMHPGHGVMAWGVESDPRAWSRIPGREVEPTSHSRAWTSGAWDRVIARCALATHPRSYAGMGELVTDDDSPDLPPRRRRRSPMGALTRIVDRRLAAVKSRLAVVRRRRASAPTPRSGHTSDARKLAHGAAGPAVRQPAPAPGNPPPTRHFPLLGEIVVPGRRILLACSRDLVLVARAAVGSADFRVARQPFGNACLTQTSYGSQTSGKPVGALPRNRKTVTNQSS